MGIVLDARETRLAAALAGRAQTRPLVVADALLTQDDDGVDGRVAVKMAFERKTLEDLRASVFDGRYEDQRARLLAAYGVERVAYIIETGGKDAFVDDPLTAAVLTGLIVRRGVKVFFTRGVEDTAALLKHLSTARLEPQAHASGAACNAPVPVANVPKARAETPADALRAMVQVVPGVSAAIAREVCRRYASVGDLARAVLDAGGGVPQQLAEVRVKGRRCAKTMQRLCGLLVAPADEPRPPPFSTDRAEDHA